MSEILLDRAKALRKELSPAERQLWYQFLKHYPVPFQKQKPIGPYIVDFYCHQARLVIELDGSQHYDPPAITYDRRRTEYLTQKGLSVLRYPNNQIRQNFPSVCEQIDQIIKQKLGML